jgi:hypothetical protein
MKKKGFLFTTATLLLFLSIFAITSVYLDRNKELQSEITVSGISDRLRYIEDDVVSNVYSDLTSLRLSGITKDHTIILSFNQILFAPGRDYEAIMNNYKEFIEGTYSSMNNVEIALNGLSTNFTIMPYDHFFQITGQSITGYTMPVPAMEIESIGVTVDVDAENSSTCLAPGDDHAQHPLITVTFIYKKAGGGKGSCTNSVQLDPRDDNDIGGHQFFMETTNPTGYVDVKYGAQGVVNGIFSIQASGINANVSQLDIEYEPTQWPIRIQGGNISIGTTVRSFTKASNIILAQE